MRVSEKQRFWQANNRIETAKSDSMDKLGLLSTQKKINALHDDPVGASRVIKHRDQITKYDSYMQNATFAKGYLDVSEAALSGISDRLSRATELTMAMANDTYAGDSRNATALEIKSIIEEITQLANSKYNGKYVFSGFRTTSPAIDPEGTFLGDDGAIFLQIGEDSFRQINVEGRNLFEASPDEKKMGHVSMLATLASLEEALKASDKDLIYQALGELEHHSEKTHSFQASIGATWNTLEESGKRLELAKENEIRVMSDTEDADIYEATSNFKKAEAILQSTLMASNKFLQPSLLNFIQ